ncbi:WD40 repeat domain-containing serine/threonine protein kinase [Anatilimnocola floriformis]|uniref:WD40 repeat domain-containing serine/threonine protein kinase n=1 Tax=Anatilimnocola floriformis TaxID=2948575 RepID=UPI0020C51D63|nr:serine/threonine-protein kinase [Anatilimnocola floriformis]
MSETLAKSAISKIGAAGDIAAQSAGKKADLRPTASEVWQIEQICDEFEAAWKAGQHPKLESFLRRANTRLHEVLLSQLLPLELEYRWRAGEMPRPAEYEMRFPSVTDIDEQITAARREAFNLSGSDQLLPERIGEYRLIRLIGRGGMGVVYEALHEVEQRRVALKMLSRMSQADAIARERFRREAEATGKLTHPNIVQIFEVGEFQGQPFLALEYVAGPTLAEQWKQSRRSPAEAAEIVEQLARAIHYAHEQGIIHRDLKPGNVLLSPDRPKITDFGLATPLESSDLTMTGEIVGTPDYMSPEQARGKCSRQNVGKAADVYALGAMLYTGVAGRPPFQGATALDALELVRSHEPVFPSRINPAVPRDLETICLKCLEKDPTRRYATAEALADDLHRFLMSEPVLARRPGQFERFRRLCRRNPVTAVTTVLGLVAMLLAVGFTASHSVTLQLRAEQKLTKEALRNVEIQKSRAEDNALQLTQQQALTTSALVDAERFRQRAEALSTSLAMERGLTLIDQGDVGRGMLLLGHCLQIAPASDKDLHHVIRANLAAIHRRMPLQLHAVLEHKGEVRAAAFSPNGKLLLAGGRNSRPQLWDVETGKPIGEPLPHGGEVKSVVFSHDGTFVVTASTDKTVRVWDTLTRVPIGELLAHPQAVHSMALSSDNKLLATGCNDGTTTLWELPSGTQLRQWKQAASVHTMAFSPDGGKLVTGNAMRRAQMWNVQTGEPFGEAMVHQGEVLSAAYRPDGWWLVTGTENGSVQFWEANTGKSIGFPLVHRGPVRTVGYSADGRTLWTGGAYGQVRLWDAAIMTPLGSPIHHQSVVHTVAQTKDQRYLATGSADGILRIWQKPDVADQSLVIPHKHLVYCLAISPDGESLVSGTADPTGQIRSTKTGAIIGQPLVHKHSLLDAAYSPDGKVIVTASIDRTARLWNAADGTPIGEPLVHTGHVYSVMFSPDGQTLLTGAKDNGLRFWNPKTGEQIGETIMLPNWVHAAVYSPDGQTILTGCEDGNARLYDVATRELITTIPHRGPVKAAAFSPDGTKFLTGTWDDRTARLFDAETLEPIGPPLAHQEHVLAVAFSPDSKTMATGAWDGTARLWDVATGRPISPPLVHQYAIRDVAFSPDGSRLWTGGFDRMVKAWELTPPTTGEVNHIVTWLQVLTGLELDADGVFRELNSATWTKRRDQLTEFGGPPTVLLPARSGPVHPEAGRVDMSFHRPSRAEPSS